jgi:hypothetical protein
MKKIFSICAVLILLLSSGAYAQWVNEGAWPDETIGQLHGIAVDPDGKVWLGNFGLEWYTPPGGGDSIQTRLIRVYNPDGSPAAFSPIWQIIVGGVTDTLNSSNTRGMRADNNGNILIVDGAQRMYRINYQTGQGMNKVELGLGTSPVAPAAASNGSVFVGPVVMEGLAIQEYDTDFNFLGNAVENLPGGFSRSMEVSEDGNTIYFPSYTADVIIIYQRADEFSPFDSIGVIAGPAAESIVWNKATGHLWFSGGSFNDMPDPESIYTPNTWYAYDVSTNEVKDSLKWAFTIPEDPNERPRGIDFSPNGGIAYIGCFGGPGYPLAQKVVNPDVGVRPDPDFTVRDYTLSQNYPNPFNPTTEIKFSILESGFVTLKVYDLLGKEVATLVDENLQNGGYVVTFDASDLASGTYIYTLSVNGSRISKKMLLLK